MFTELPTKLQAYIKDFTGRAWMLPRIVEWLDQSDDRLFLVLGKPGSGKSMVSAWLAGFGPVPSESAEAGALGSIRSKIRALHFCQANSSNSPKAFADSVARQLARTVDHFAESVTASLSDRAKIVNIDSKVNVQNAQAGVRLTGVELHLELGSLTDEPSFDRVLREPIKALYLNGTGDPLVIIVDALDESLNYTGVPNLVQLLNRLEDLPKPCRILATTRPDSRVLDFFPDVRRLDIVDEEQPANDAIRHYSYGRLDMLDEAPRQRLAKRISDAAEGQFLFARLLLDDRKLAWSDKFDPETVSLPAGLSGFYQQNLGREITANNQRWHDRVRPVLSLLTVAQGDGLTRQQIERISKKDVQESVQIVGQYLDGARPGGPFRLFHKSLGDYLIDSEIIEAPRTNGEIADYYQSLRNGTIAWKRWDLYGLMYVATHLADAARPGDPDQVSRAEQLVRIVLNEEFQRQHKKQCGDLTALQLDLQRALRAAAGCHEQAAIPLVVEAALGILSFRQNELRPEPLFDLALKGDVLEAAQRADMFELDSNWRQAVPLILAWFAAPTSLAEAQELRDRQFPKGSDPALQTLVMRVDSALGRGAMPVLNELPQPPNEFSIQLVVNNLGGNADAELVQHTRNVMSQNMSHRSSKFWAIKDGPLLVSFAQANPPSGDRFLRDYIGVHTGYQYVHYRQGSLWILMEAVLSHPDQEWVRLMLRELAASAMAGSTAEFQESLPLTILGLRASSADSVAKADLQQSIDKAIDDAKSLQPQRGRNDSWGFYKRRFAALAQACSLVQGMANQIADLLDRAAKLPYGFGGFQSPACLNLAETIHICIPKDAAGIEDALEHARSAAENILEESFCARQTARVNTMQRRWWKASSFDVAKTVSRLVAEPSAVDFCTLHIVGQEYGGRTLKATAARTLEQLAEVYHRPLDEFLRVNGRKPAGLLLDDNQEINVPDRGFPTQLSACFAAQALADPSLDADDRVALVRSLVPLASANATVLDTVLARLLIAAKTSGGQLDTIEQLCKGRSTPPPADSTARFPA